LILKKRRKKSWLLFLFIYLYKRVDY